MISIIIIIIIIIIINVIRLSDTITAPPRSQVRIGKRPGFRPGAGTSGGVSAEAVARMSAAPLNCYYRNIHVHYVYE